MLLIVPVVIPPVIAAYAVVGERDQGTLEPILTAPIRASELLLGKAALPALFARFPEVRDVEAIGGSLEEAFLELTATDDSSRPGEAPE